MCFSGGSGAGVHVDSIAQNRREVLPRRAITKQMRNKNVAIASPRTLERRVSSVVCLLPLVRLIVLRLAQLASCSTRKKCSFNSFERSSAVERHNDQKKKDASSSSRTTSNKAAIAVITPADKKTTCASNNKVVGETTARGSTTSTVDALEQWE